MIFDGDRDKLGDYLRDMADRIGLRDWHISVTDESPENPQHQACIDVRYGRKVANISFASNWASLDVEDLRQCCCHELLHCHVNPTKNVIDNIHSTLGGPLYNATYNALMDYLEVAIDGIATAWAQTLPLPVVSEVEDAVDRRTNVEAA